MNTRAINMEKRRQRILLEARRVIAAEGFQGLNTRSLAQAAGVSQPTLYNLIGGKDDIILILVSETMKKVESRFAAFAKSEPLEFFEAVATESTALFNEDEDFYRAAFIANEFFPDQEKIWGRSAGLVRWADALAIKAIEKAQKNGQLRGRISAETLGEQFFVAIRVASRDWAFRLISIDDFRMTALRAAYTLLAADAEEDFHQILVKKLKRLRRLTPKKAVKRAS